MFHNDGEQVLHDDLKLAVDMALANTSSESESASGLRQGENNTTANDALQQAIWDKHAYILRFDGGVDADDGLHHGPGAGAAALSYLILFFFNLPDD